MRREDRSVTELDGIEAILKECRTCHLAMVDEGKPYVVPLSYGYQLNEDGTLTLYFHSAKEGRKLDILRKNNLVCFEISREGELIDGNLTCNYGYDYASVIGNGEVVFSETAGEKCEALSHIFYQQAERKVEFEEKQAEAVCVFQVVSRDFIGKRKSRK